jgi:hypothetical protein
MTRRLYNHLWESTLPNRTLAVGDIHGHLADFDTLLQCVALTPDDHIILLDDCVDRGRESAGVLTRIIRPSQTHQPTTIMGNHEQMMLAICIDTNACRGGELTCLDASSGRIWQANATGRVRQSHISGYPAQ